jgi:pseudoazurin
MPPPFVHLRRMLNKLYLLSSEPFMSHLSPFAFLVLTSLVLVGCGAGESEFELTASQKIQVDERTAPVGSVMMAGQVSIVDAGSSQADVKKVSLSEGSEHIVKMLNSGDGGNMIFEPAVIKVSKGDTIHFKAMDMAHNSATIEGMIPEGAASWASALSQDVSITLDAEGVYVYQCDPHAMMAMVGVIQVGEAVNMSEIQASANQHKSNFMMNGDRLSGYLSQL